MRPTPLLLAVISAALLLPAASFAAERSDHPSARQADGSTATGDVVLYVLPDCGYCEKTRELLARHEVTWREVDIAASAEGKRAFDARGGVGTPLTVIGGDQVQGYSVARIESLLSQHGLIER